MAYTTFDFQSRQPMEQQQNGWRVPGVYDFASTQLRDATAQSSANLALTTEQANAIRANTEMEKQRLAYEQELEKQRLANEQATQQQAAALASQFLGTYQQGLGQVSGMFNTAIEQANKAYSLLETDPGGAFAKLNTLVDELGARYKDPGGAFAKLNTLADELGVSYKDYQDTFGGLRDELVTAARSDLKDRQGMISSYKDLISPANIEASANRAKADVAFAGEQAQQAEARRLTGMGVDPTSGRSRSAMTGIGNQTALSSALAGNTARTNERQRLTGATAQGIQLVNPADTAGLAVDIDKGGRDLVTSQAGLVKAGLEGGRDLVTAQAGLVKAGLEGRTQMAKTASDISGNIANIAGQYARTTMEPFGQLGATFLGRSMAT